MKATGGRRQAEVGREGGSTPVTGRESPLTRVEGSSVTAFVALGSNLDEPVQRIRTGLRGLAALPLTRLARASSLYRNPPVGYLDQPDFVNAVAAIDTRLSARALLGRLLEIERAQGRVRALKDGPRTLDLDIILYGDEVIEEPDLVVPHPRLCERAFVLLPLAEIAPEAMVPGRGRAAELLKAVDAARLVRL
jgi:2-amino-4-hydroxy-6-hydroxymethyldihydropteridine diphosphokinase